MARHPFPVNPEYTGLVIAYRNKSLIADDVLPRVPVGKEDFKYLLYPQEEGFTIPDTHVGRKSRPNQISFSATEVSSYTIDYGLEDAIPQSDIDNAPQGYDPLARASQQLIDMIELDREQRVANLVFNASTYSASNKTTLSGTSQWSDHTNSTPIDDILGAMDSMLIRPTIMVLGALVWTKLRTHPEIVKAVHGNSGDKGITTRKEVANLFELNEVLVGESFINTAKKGQTATYSRAWGKYCALLHKNTMADNRNGLTFGFTAQNGTRVAGNWEDKNIGLKGGQRIRVGESVREVVSAADAGYLFIDAIA